MADDENNSVGLMSSGQARNDGVASALFWKNHPVFWLVIIISIAIAGFAFQDTIRHMLKYWESSEEYGYSYLIPPIIAFLIWQRKNQLAKIEFNPAISGLVVILIGGGLFFLGAVATTHALSQYGIVVTVLGAALTLLGWRGFRIVAVPLALLFFVVPLPQFIYNTLSTKLQLISSEIGVAVIRLFGISVYLEGNVIDLGTYKLQVVEACSGLRYLFPLVSISFIAAYLYKAEFWKRVILFLSSIPITVLMNSFRVGVIGVLVEYGGSEQAEGFLHDFEGWVVFMACTGLLVLEMAVLSKIGPNKKSLADAFVLDFPEPVPEGARVRTRKIAPFIFMVPAVLSLISITGIYVDNRVNTVPERRSFGEFPLTVSGWTGEKGELDADVLEALATEDYIITNFANAKGDVVNFYVAYYDDQAAGSSAHSPRACIPGGGWLIKNLSVVPVGGLVSNGRVLKANRLLIKKGDYTQLVYYWFQQRGRILTSEWMVKWYLFWDAMTRNRTDGALVRLSTIVRPGEDIDLADARLVDFAKVVYPHLDDFIPD